MEVNEEPVESSEDVQASTSKDQQESALTSCQAFSHAGGKPQVCHCHKDLGR